MAPPPTTNRPMPGQRPPMEFSRPEVADVLIQWAKAAG